MSMDYLTLLQSLGLTPLNMVLVVMLYFMGAQAGIFPKLWKSNGEEAEEKEEVPTWARQLQQHFNDEISSILHEIRDGVKKLDEHGDVRCAKIDKITLYLEDSHEDAKEWRSEVREFMRDFNKK